VQTGSGAVRVVSGCVRPSPGAGGGPCPIRAQVGRRQEAGARRRGGARPRRARALMT
jgi:hypothetical protein